MGSALLKIVVSVIRKYHDHIPQTTIYTARKSRSTITRHQEDKFSKATSDYSDYPKSLISRINEVNVFSIKLKKTHKLHLSHLFCCNHTCYCVNKVFVTSAPRYITSASRYHRRYHNRSTMYIRGLPIPRNCTKLAEAVVIAPRSF